MNIKEKIMESALKLFVQKGFSVSTSAITKDAGVSAGILFHYFPTKNDLIISLYTDILYEYYKSNVNITKKFKKNNLQSYRSTIRASWYSVIIWGLDNWDKFVFMQIFNGSVLADQFISEGNEEIKKMSDRLTKMTQLGIEYGYLKELPYAFHNTVLPAMIMSITTYLRENPDYRNDDFMEKAWQVCWNAIAK